MATNNSSNFITKLNRDTKEGKVLWNIFPRTPSSICYDEEPLGYVYQANILDRSFILYKYQVKSFYDDETYTWEERYRLENIDANGKSIYTISNESSIYDLYDTVQYHTSKIGDFFADYLKDFKDDLPFG